MNEFEITGRARTHVVELEQLPNSAAAGSQSPGPAVCTVHYEVAASFLALKDAALSVGIKLVARSSFRDFATQQLIWNRKWKGERPLLGRDGRPLERTALSDAELLDAILTWSAVPGGSRHHWGTDIDVVDADAIPYGYTVQLVAGEYATDGIFARLNAWLDANMARFGFFKPYRTDRGGVCPEPWHISYAPVAVPALEALSLSTLRRALQESEIEGSTQVLARLPEIYTRYLLAIDQPPTV